MTRLFDPDLKALRDAARALENSSSPRMLRANLIYLWDRFIERPPQEEDVIDDEGNIVPKEAAPAGARPKDTA